MKTATKLLAALAVAACAAGVYATQSVADAQQQQTRPQLPPRPAPPTPEQEAARTAEVAAAVAEQERRFAAAPRPSAADGGTAYQFEFAGLWTETVPLTAFRGEVVLVVNTASRCGYTPQYQGLQQIYNDYRAQGFEVLGVPSANFRNQEYGTAEEIQEFCTLNYGVTFPMAGATDVVTDPERGLTAHPFYQWAQSQAGDAAIPRWNFHKILVGRDGRVIATFPTNVDPASEQVRTAIASALGPRG
jgi:glutathione peroxidase